MGQLFDLQFSFAGRTAIVVTFLINNTQRLPTSKVFGSASIGMLSEAPHRIRGNTRIERAIRAQDYIDMPVHDLSSAPFPALAIFLTGKPGRRRAIAAVGRQPV